MKTMLAYRATCLLCVCQLSVISLFSQISASREFPLSRGEIKKITSRYFGNLVTSQTSSGTLGNFASLDPTSGSFKFQGTAFLGKDNATTDTSFISFLSFSGKGDLIGESYASLFSNSSLNTGISMSASYHILIGRPKVSLSLDDYAFYEMSKGAVQKKYDREYDLIDKETRTIIKERIAIVDKEIKLTDASIDDCITKRKTLVANLGNDVSKWQVMIDSAKANEENIQKYEKAKTALSLKMDSLTVALKNFPAGVNYLGSYKQGKSDDDRQKAQDSLIVNFPFVKHAFSWITFTGGGGKQNYVTYDATASFDNQIHKAEYNNYNFGFSYNYFSKNTLNNRLIYLNAGVSRERTNNIDLLTTKAITDTKKNVNSAGDVTRVVEKKYNAYTDPILEDEGWKFFFNSYFMFGKQPSGFHFFPEIHFLDSKTTIANIGIGYIISFANTKKDQPVINTEVYFKLKDLANQGGSGIADIWNRNEIGLSFTLPINFFTK